MKEGDPCPVCPGGKMILRHMVKVDLMTMKAIENSHPILYCDWCGHEEEIEERSERNTQLSPGQARL